MSLSLRKRLAAVLGCSILAGAVTSATAANDSDAEYKGISVSFIERAVRELAGGMTLADGQLIGPNADLEDLRFDQLTERGQIFVRYLGKKYFEDKLDPANVSGLLEHNGAFFNLVAERGEEKVKKVLGTISPLAEQIESLSHDVQEVSRGMGSVAESLLRSMERENSALMRTVATPEGEDAQQTAHLAEENERLASENKRLIEERENLVSKNKQFAEEREQVAADFQQVLDERNQLATEKQKINTERLQAVASIKAMGKQVQDLKSQMETLQKEQGDLVQAVQKALDDPGNSKDSEKMLRDFLSSAEKRNFSRQLEKERGLSKVHDLDDEQLEQEKQYLAEQLQGVASQQEETQGKTDRLKFQAHQEVLKEASARVEGEQLTRFLTKFGYDSETGKLEDESRREDFMAGLENFGEGVAQSVRERIADIWKKSEEIAPAESENHVSAEANLALNEEEQEESSIHSHETLDLENQPAAGTKDGDEDGQSLLQDLSEDHHESAKNSENKTEKQRKEPTKNDSEREDSEQVSTQKPKSSDKSSVVVTPKEKHESDSESGFDHSGERSEKLSKKAANRSQDHNEELQPSQEEVKDEFDQENASASQSDLDQESEHESRKPSSNEAKPRSDEVPEDELVLSELVEDPSVHEEVPPSQASEAEVLPSKAPDVIKDQPWVLQDSEQERQESSKEENEENLASSASKKQDDEASEHAPERQIQQDEPPHSEEGGENLSENGSKEQKDKTPENSEAEA